MTDKEILIKVLEKTKFDQYILDCLTKDDLTFYYFVKNLKIRNNAPVDELYEEFSVRDIIFDHDFAKAFFGEVCLGSSYDVDCKPVPPYLYRWQYHLQNMVLEKEPLKYLEKFLYKEKS